MVMSGGGGRGSRFNNTYDNEVWEETAVVCWDGGSGSTVSGEVSFPSFLHMLHNLVS
jgi:hypothetical protein